VKLKATPPDNALSVEDTLALVNDAATGHRTLGPLCAALVVELLFTMGLRVSEICNLDVDQLSWVERDGRAYRSIAFIGKGEKEHVRGIPLELDVERLTPYLNQRPEPATLEDGPALLLTVDGRRLGRHQVARLLARSARRVLGRKVTPHFGRHTFNRRCEEAGISVEDRRDAMGHASVVTTEGYGRTRKDVVNDPSHTVAAVLQLARNTYTSPHNDEGRHDGYRSRPA
jgi:integrase/recombinase XerC